MNEEYVLSRSFLSADGEPVRSMCCLNIDGVAFSMDMSNDDNASGGSLSSNNMTNVVALGSQGGIITQTINQPHSTTGGEGFSLTTFQGGHSHAITAMYGLSDSTMYATGCKDNNIRIFDFSKDNFTTKAPAQILQGHGNAVTSLSSVTLVNDQDSNDTMTFLVSGSWDGSAKCWSIDAGTCLCTMGGHENTVCVQGLPPSLHSSDSKPSATGAATYRGSLATGSAGVAQGNAIVNMKLRIWDLVLQEGGGVQASLRCSVQDHMGPIRDLCLDPNTQCLASVSNDGTLKLRDCSTGEALSQWAHPGTNEGAPPLILSVTALGNGRFVTCTEDGCAYVWDSTLDSNFTAPVHTILHPDCVWRVQSVPGGDGADFMSACNDGQARIFTLDGLRAAPPAEVEAFQHAVTEAVEKKQKAASGGGGPSPEEISKLPDWHTARYSMIGKSEGMVQLFQKDGTAIAAQWSVASGTWIEVGEVTGSNQNAGSIDGVSYDHVFPIEIDVPGGGVRSLKIGYNNGENPFLTAQQFIDKHELDQNYLGQIADYIRQRAGETNTPPTLGMGAAPQGSSAPPPAPTSPDKSVPTLQYLPMRGYRLFETGADKGPISKILAKIREFNTEVPPADQLSTEQAGNLLDGLGQTLSATNRYHSSEMTSEELKTVTLILSRWAPPKAFPAMDLARLMALHPDATSRQRTAYWSSLFGTVLDRQLSNIDILQGTAAVAIPMLSLRLFCNAFKGFGSCDALSSSLPAILRVAAVSCASSTNKNVRLSVATIGLNTSSFLLMKSLPLSESRDTIESLLDLLSAILTQYVEKYEKEAISRTLIALGTSLMLPGQAGQTVKTLCLSRNLTSDHIVSLASSQDAEVKGIAEEISSLLH